MKTKYPKYTKHFIPRPPDPGHHYRNHRAELIIMYRLSFETSKNCIIVVVRTHTHTRQGYVNTTLRAPRRPTSESAPYAVKTKYTKHFQSGPIQRVSAGEE
jgi:hypothetical protein